MTVTATGILSKKYHKGETFLRQVTPIMVLNCSACGHKGGTFLNPVLGVPLCEDCHGEYYSGEFTVEDKNEIYCRWCGGGDGQLLLCDSCPKSFCTRCIGRNFGAIELLHIRSLDERWNCIVCSPQSFYDLCKKNGWGNGDSQKFKSSKGVICPDISRGREKYEIPVVNEVDNAPPPLDFTYINSFVTTHETPVMRTDPSLITCCSCTDGCRDVKKCECIRRMGSAAYNNDNALLQHRTTAIYECSSRCLCHINQCTNRVVTHGPSLRLEVFRCDNPMKGWGVRCRDDIPAGTYVADYIGEIMEEEAGENRGIQFSDQYLFNMDYFTQTVAERHLSHLGFAKDPSLFGTVRTSDTSGPTARHRKIRERERVEANVNITCMTREDLLRHLDPALVDLLDSKGAIERAHARGKRLRTDPEAFLAEVDRSLNDHDSTGEKGRKEKARKPPKALPSRNSAPKGAPPSSSLKIANNNNFSSSSTISEIAGDVSTVPVLDSWAESQLKYRIKVRDEARGLLRDRKMAETEATHATYVIDARWFGNVGRFINHSCEGNLDKMTVFCGESQDERMPRLAFFANELIAAGTELCYDYGYQQGNVEGQSAVCLCGAKLCRKTWY